MNKLQNNEIREQVIKRLLIELEQLCQKTGYSGVDIIATPVGPFYITSVGIDGSVTGTCDFMLSNLETETIEIIEKQIKSKNERTHR
jgi:hypothetical protein